MRRHTLVSILTSAEVLSACTQVRRDLGQCLQIGSIFSESNCWVHVQPLHFCGRIFYSFKSNQVVLKFSSARSGLGSL